MLLEIVFTLKAEVESCSGSGSECVQAIGPNLTLPMPILSLVLET